MENSVVSRVIMPRMCKSVTFFRQQRLMVTFLAPVLSGEELRGITRHDTDLCSGTAPCIWIQFAVLHASMRVELQRRAGGIRAREVWVAGCVCRPVGLVDVTLVLFHLAAGEGTDQERQVDPGVLVDAGDALHGTDAKDREDNGDGAGAGQCRRGPGALSADGIRMPRCTRGEHQ